MQPTMQQTRVNIRWMIRRDMESVLKIELACFPQYAWSEDQFVSCLHQKNCIGMAAEHDERVVGFMLYELHEKRLHVLNFAVDPEWRHRGVGSQMLNKLKGKLTRQRRSRIVLEVRDSNLPAQLFFRACGFRAVSLVRDFYDDSADCADDAYVFEYLCNPST